MKMAKRGRRGYVKNENVERKRLGRRENKGNEKVKRRTLKRGSKERK